MKKILILFSIFNFITATLSAQELQSNFIIEGIKMYDKGDYEGALEMYKKALASNPASTQAKYEIASTYLQLKDYNTAIKYIDKVIAANRDYVDQAYILKGSALDYLNKPQDAANTYREAIKKFPKNQLLYYNLALTSFNLKDYKQTDEALMKSLKLNQLHSSSHFLLGLSMITQGKRVQGMLALYNFLLLEPKGKKAASVWETLDEEWKKVTVKSKAASKTSPATNVTEDEFSTADLMIETLESSKNNEANKNKPAITLFIENTNAFFTTLGEEKKDKKGFWWNFYVDYFYKLALNHHTEALCYYITQSKDNAYDEWMRDNLKKMESFSEWYTKYLHKF